MLTGSRIINPRAPAIARPATRLTCGTRNGRSMSGCVRRRTSTPAPTIKKAISVPMETSSPSTSIGDSPATVAPAIAHTTVVKAGVLKRGSIRSKARGSIPSADMRMRMRVWP